ncbi:hypothetical protein AB0F81_33380 [Actinoplanes sp. NPDC024001]|uniref:hypothetical protein n=1 Tax=Actinoplanes sp. NPDC024001 TaxID=3154598 RepID=UPI0033DD15AC
MKRAVRTTLVAGFIATAAVFAPAAPALAEPCGASSYHSDGKQYVGYRNCGSTTVMMKGHIAGSWGGCRGITAYSSGVLREVNRSSYTSNWGVAFC